MWNANINPDHAFTSWPSYKLTFEKSAIFLIKLTTRMKKKIIWTIKPKTYWFYTEKLIYKRENSRDVLLAIKCKDSVGHFVRLVFWSFQMNFMPEYKILSFCDIYHTKLKNLFCLMIYDVTCELFKKRIQNRQQVAVPAWMKHDENELRNQSLFTKFPIYSARNEDLLFIGLWHIQLENLIFLLIYDLL